MPEDRRRLFFALWPDPELRRAIVARRLLLGQPCRRRVPDENLHLTLLFLGDQPAARVEEILAGAGGIRNGPFKLELDGFGWFPRAQVVWLGGEAPETGQVLVGRLEAAMEGLEVDFDRRPWKPHVTLFRKVVRRPGLPDPPPLAWPVEEFALVESIPGKPYQILRTWPLQWESA